MYRSRLTWGSAFAASIATVAAMNPMVTLVASPALVASGPGTPEEAPMPPEQAIATDLQAIAQMWNVPLEQAATIVDAQ